MSKEADRVRRKLRAWAAPGGSHDRTIRLLRLVLPVGIGLLVVALAFVPLARQTDISFVLAKDRVDVASERMRVADARYSGVDSKGQAFMIQAGSAVQRTSADPIVRLADLTARIVLKDGPAAIAARRGRYNIEDEQVLIDGPVVFKSADGYGLRTENVTVDLADRNLESRGRVTGAGPLGTFEADHIRADFDARTVTLEGRARLHITQRQSRGS